MDWEAQIEKVCDRLDLPANAYNDDDVVKEVVAKLLGFPSFECFNSIPEPSTIIDGRGTMLLEGHKLQQLPIAKECIDLIIVHFQMSLDDIELEREVTRFVKYIEENFDDEFATAALILLIQKVTPYYKLLTDLDCLEPYKTQLWNLTMND